MLRAQLPRDFPGVSFYNLPVDIVTQILNFGLARSHRHSGGRQQARAEPAVRRKTSQRVEVHPGRSRFEDSAAFQLSEFHIDVNRTKAQELGYSETERSLGFAGIPERKFSDGAIVLARPQKRSQLQRPIADAAVSNQQPARSSEYSDHERRDGFFT